MARGHDNLCIMPFFFRKSVKACEVNSLPLSVWTALIRKPGATKIPSRTRVVLLRKRKGKSVFDWGWLQLRLVESSSQIESSNRQLKCAVWQTNPPFRVPLTFGAGVAWSSCLSSRLPRVTRCHRYNPAVTRTSCALANYGASDLCPELTNSIGSPLSPGQTCCHQVPKQLCHAAVANLV
ncbi:hypothetical protein PIB30_017922 [Stylosanthes scabra]|uniref:Uncharacterized protein n=1 Tax=Stylosanthes scabra TaxID=79078 RepID=A0ABU6R815_9FABA|nr:hypothetical protein [Stylosanthes scabra]